MHTFPARVLSSFPPLALSFLGGDGDEEEEAAEDEEEDGAEEGVLWGGAWRVVLAERVRAPAVMSVIVSAFAFAFSFSFSFASAFRSAFASASASMLGAVLGSDVTAPPLELLPSMPSSACTCITAPSLSPPFSSTLPAFLSPALFTSPPSSRSAPAPFLCPSTPSSNLPSILDSYRKRMGSCSTIGSSVYHLLPPTPRVTTAHNNRARPLVWT